MDPALIAVYATVAIVVAYVVSVLFSLGVVRVPSRTPNLQRDIRQRAAFLACCQAALDDYGLALAAWDIAHGYPASPEQKIQHCVQMHGTPDRWQPIDLAIVLDQAASTRRQLREKRLLDLRVV